MVVFVRKVRTASGATAVQIAERQDGRDKVLEHLGSSLRWALEGIVCPDRSSAGVPGNFSLGHQNCQLGLGPRRPHVLEDVVTPAAPFSELDLRRARTARRLPDEHHNANPTHQRGTSIQTLTSR